MYCISYTRFGYRQNSRTHWIFQFGRQPVRIVRVPAYARLKRDEVLRRQFRMGRSSGFHETGDPKFVAPNQVVARV